MARCRQPSQSRKRKRPRPPGNQPGRNLACQASPVRTKTANALSSRPKKRWQSPPRLATATITVTPSPVPPIPGLTPLAERTLASIVGTISQPRFPCRSRFHSTRTATLSFTSLARDMSLLMSSAGLIMAPISLMKASQTISSPSYQNINTIPAARCITGTSARIS